MPVSSACRRSPALAPALTSAAPGYVLRLSVEPLLRTRAAMRDRRVFPLQDRKTYNVPLRNPPYRRTRESAGHFSVPSIGRALHGGPAPEHSDLAPIREAQGAPSAHGTLRRGPR